jgi:S-disulfanyl-L-cysteine oxidoreductase SoxD
MSAKKDSRPTSGSGRDDRLQLKSRIGAWVFGATFLFLAGAIAIALWTQSESPADPDDARQVAQGKPVYDKHCAACHGARLEGQPNWQQKLPNGRMPAPPHDASGHTWHHPDTVLFGITKYGMVPGKYAPPKYQSDMMAFGGALSDDEIWAVLAYIKSSWPGNIRKVQREATLNQRHR